MTISLDSDKVLKWLQLLLLIVITGLLVWSQPWNETGSASGEQRKLTVSGESTIKAEPDEYLFTPYFEAKGTDKEALKKDLNDKANAAVAKLKELGVEDKNIKVDSSSYDYWFYEQDQEGTLTVSLQVTVADKAKAQEVQDYFTTLDLEGQLTPQATFSTSKRKELEKQATDKAIEDAKGKAEQQAKLIDSKLGKVIEVSQGSGNLPMPIDFRGGAELSLSADSAKASSLPVMPGENEFTWAVSVTYELK